MVVICEECGLKYQIDPSKISGEKVRFNCKGCASSILVEKNKEDEEDLTSLEDALLAAEDSTRQQQQVDEEKGDPLAQLSASGAYALEGEAEVSATLDDSSSQPAGSDAQARTAASGPGGKRAGLSLTYKVILLMLLVSLLPGGIYFALSFNQTNERIISETNRTGKKVTEMLSSEVDEWIDKNTRVLNTIANTPAVKSMNRYDQEVLLKAVQREYPWMYLVFTTDERGMNTARSDGRPLKDYTNRDYVKKVVQGADLAWQNLIGKTSKKPALVLAVPIKRGDIIVGVLAAAMTREAISELVTTYSEGQTGSSFLVDESGRAVAHKKNAYVLQQEDLSNHPLVKAAGKDVPQRAEFVDANSRETIGFAKQTDLGWTLAIQQEKREAFAPLKKAQMFAYYMLGGTVVVILIIAYFASRAIVTPIRNLTDAANRISVGDLDVEISTSSKDEIGELAAAIMRMQDSIRLSIARLTRRRR